MACTLLSVELFNKKKMCFIIEGEWSISTHECESLSLLPDDELQYNKELVSDILDNSNKTKTLILIQSIVFPIDKEWIRDFHVKKN